MRAAFAAMCAVLLSALAVCFFSMGVQGGILEELGAMCDAAVECIDGGDPDAAADAVAELDDVFSEKRGIMELLASHNDLHDAAGFITDAAVALKCGDTDDAYQALMQLKGVLEHLREHESLSLGNLLCISRI